ncbi:MAG: RNA polymerase sigma factor [Verrucomicrobiia bacterium]
MAKWSMSLGEIDSRTSLQRIREGDSDAAKALIEALYPLVIRIVRSHLPRRMSEEDLAQEIFVKALSKLDQYEERRGIPLEHWISRLAVRTCLDALRAERRRPEVRMADLSEDEAAWLEFVVRDESAPPHSPAESARELLEKLLAQLPPEDRMVIMMLDLEERSVKEIATITGWNISLVKVRAFRARQKLRKLAGALNRSEFL